MKPLIVVLTFATIVATQAHADERFAVIERGETVIRVDTKTGRVSFCRDENGKPVCKIAADERQAWMAEVDALEKQVSQLGEKSPESSSKLSSKDEKDLDKAMDTAETIMRRFFNMMRSLKDDLKRN